MYSSLHEKIAKLVAKKKYAVTSCWAKKIYLPSFKFTLAATIINNFGDDINQQTLNKIRSLSTYHHTFVKKVEKRELSSNELYYMAKFYLGLKKYIQEKKIDLVIVHNDTRWYHAIAIFICKEFEIKYLVTEQGLIRPDTTVIDKQGVNANANIDLNIQGAVPNKQLNFKPKHTHDSALSMMFFFLFISVFTIERLIKSPSLLRFMHNNYQLGTYKQRLLNQLIKKIGVETKGKMKKNSALLLLQLEHDSQFLMHSDYDNNQEVINELQRKCNLLGLTLAVKKHPLDQALYQLDNDSYFVNCDIISLSKKAKIVVSVNSSAILSVLKTKTPLFIIGQSIYHYRNMVTHCRIENITINPTQNYNERCHFVYKIKENYLLTGSGYSYHEGLLKSKLISLLDGHQ